MFEELTGHLVTPDNCPAVWDFFAKYYLYVDTVEAIHE